MHHLSKRLLALLLALLLCVSLFPAAALAEEPEEPAPAEEPAEDPVEEDIILPPPTDEPDALPPAADEPEDVVASGTCGDNLTWTLDSDGLLTISGTGDMWDWEWGTMPWVDYKTEINLVDLPSGVTSIGEYAFYGCNNLMSVTIPEGVTSIKRGAFMACSGLSDVTIPEGVEVIGARVFNGCQGLNSVTIPEGVTSIGEGVFTYCISLTSVTIPESVTSIGNNAFEDSTSLTDICYDSTMAAWKQLAVDYDHYGVTVHCSDGDIAPADAMYCGDELIWSLNSEGVLTVDGTGDMWDFMDNKNPWYSSKYEVKSVHLISGVTSIGNYAFEECVNLTSVTIPDGVTSIGRMAFFDCDRLIGVTIPDSVAVIEACAFTSCSSMTSVTIQEGVTSIGEYAFDGCTSLTEIRFGGSAPNFGNDVFFLVTATAYYPGDDPTWTEDVRQNYGGTITWVTYEPDPTVVATGDCGDNLTWTLDSDGLLTISGTGDMWDWEWGTMPWNDYRRDIVSVEILSGVTGIGSHAFDYCYSLTNVIIPEGVTNIGDGAFNDCGPMRSVMIPESLSTIGAWAFYDSGLTSVTIPEGVISVGEFAFINCRLTDIYYGSTRTAWKRLAVDYDHYTVPVHCSDGDIAPADPMCCGDDLTWTLNEDGLLTISGTGDMWNWESHMMPWLNRREEIINLCLPSGMTRIGYDAFWNCSSLTSVTIPESVTAIGHGAFFACSSLTEVTIPASVTDIGGNAFFNCAALTDIQLPDSLTRIGIRAFAAYSGGGLTSITIPAEVTSIGAYAFDNCADLTEIRFLGPAPEIGKHAFGGGEMWDGEIWQPVTATAYYPANDPSWTEDIRQDYGGSITWVSYEPVPEPLTLALTDAVSSPGESFTVTLKLSNNPGISGLSAEVVYDESVMTLVSAAPKIEGGSWSVETIAEDHLIFWYDAETFTGTDVIELSFRVADEAPEGTYPIGLQFGTWDGVIGESGDDLEGYAVVPGTLTVIHRIPGDINGDSNVSIADVVRLAKYVKARGVGVEIAPNSGNVDGSADGKITLTDVTLLAKYVKARGQGVVIH